MGRRALVLRWLLALFVGGAGVVHLVRPDLFEPIVPPSLPWPRMIVLVTGVVELALAAGLCLERTRRPAAYALMAYFVLVLPANVHMAVNVPGDLPRWALFARLPLQLVFILWASMFCRRRRVVDDDVAAV